MAEMKSAYERALERAEKLGRLSPDELRQRRESEGSAVGKALAERYLEHGHTRTLNQEVDRHGAAERDVIARAILLRLVDAVSLQDSETTRRALQGIRSLQPSVTKLDAEGRMQSLASEYQTDEAEVYEQKLWEMSATAGALLQELGISGSAVADVRPSASRLRAEIAEELSSRFDSRLERLKQEFLEQLPGG
ncbi:MAG: hypothetical protein SVP26_07470 [Chloroflexota bacterium]|nr:hypothetical protein [Chloroflexota bacterium]